MEAGVTASSSAALVTAHAGRPPRMPRLTLAATVMLVTGSVLAVTGVPRLPLMWLLYQMGVVLPGCGLTRGVVAIARGDLVRAWEFNPASFLAVTLALLLVVRYGVGAITDRWLSLPIPRSRWSIAALFLATAALWVNQQLHAELLINELR